MKKKQAFYSIGELLLGLRHTDSSSNEVPPQEILFRAKNKNYLVFNLDQKESIATAVDFIHKVTGTIAVFNPEYKNQTLITKYVLEKNLIPCENADGSIEIICN